MWSGFGERERNAGEKSGANRCDEVWNDHIISIHTVIYIYTYKCRKSIFGSCTVAKLKGDENWWC